MTTAPASAIDIRFADAREARDRMIQFEMLGFKGYAYHVAANTYQKALDALAELSA